MNFLLPLLFNRFGINTCALNKSISTQQFSQWLSGFIDGEGNFQVFIDRSYVRVVFRIVLHIDDIEILYKIKEFLKVGTVRFNKNYCIYTIGSIDDLINQLFPVLDKYSLITTKYLDYLDFKKVVNLLSKLGTSKLIDNDFKFILTIKEKMNSGRTLYENIHLEKKINPFWLLGFIEAEGTFGFKNLVPYFQIGQHSRNEIVLDTIINYLENLPKEYDFSEFSTRILLSKTLHKNTNVYVIVLSNIDALHDYLAPFLLSLPFQTRKKLDFLYWCLALHLHKFGFYYTNLGRSLVLHISKSINTSRYSNNPNLIEVPKLDFINEVLSLNLPFKITPKTTHLELAQKFSKLVENRKIWVYENNVLVSGSPFVSYAEAQKAIGIARTSRAISRNIDTGKLYLNRFSFYSNKQ